LNPAIRNPFWAALTTSQAALGGVEGAVRRFDPDIAPFAAVAIRGTPVDPNPLLGGRPIYFTDVLPDLIGSPVTVSLDSMYQMAFEGEPPLPPDPWPDECELGPADVADMLGLIADVYPGYFRPGTLRMGRYIGLRVDGRLVAMAGERLRFPGAFEISGVCTCPEYAGRGYAQHLIRRLLFRDQERPLLHVGCSNTRARPIYESLGFTIVAKLELLKIEPPTPPQSGSSRSA
jgi:ribosomal protein S18 acetylase RimI-like enzyme